MNQNSFVLGVKLSDVSGVGMASQDTVVGVVSCSSILMLDTIAVTSNVPGVSFLVVVGVGRVAIRRWSKE